MKKYLSLGVQMASAVGLALSFGIALAAPAYQIYVTNEKSDNVTVIDGATNTVVATIPIGKRPRGIHVSPDGRTVYVAVSGTPAAGPPQLDAQGRPIAKKDAGEGEGPADKSADGISVLDVAAGKVTGRIAAGSDPEEFALSKDGSRIYISNEDTKSATVINIAARKIEHVIPVGAEPEGVTTTPDGKFFYVTCEAGGDVFAVDTRTYRIASQFKVEGRPRSIDFTANGTGIVPSESVGQVNIVDTAKHAVVKTVTLPTGSRPMRARVAPDGAKIYVSNGRGGTLSVLDGKTFDVVGSIAAGTRPWGIAISPDGRYLYAANGPSDDVSIIDLATDKEIARVKAGSSPWGLVVVPKTT